MIRSKNPEIMVEILTKMKNFLDTGNNKTIFFTIQSLIYYIINFMNDIELFYKYKIKKKIDENKDKKNKINDLFEINDETDNEKTIQYFIKLMINII